MTAEQATALPFAWPEDEIHAFCEKWKVEELAVFGSALREDFGSASDVDLLVRFSPEAEWTLLDHARMEREMGEIQGRSVDLVTRQAIEESSNWILRKEILESARVAYAV